MPKRYAFPHPVPFAFLAAISLVACNPPERPVAEGNVSGSFFESLYGKRCSLEIIFGSYASGIDTAVHQEVSGLLGTTSSIASVASKNWGREGEKAICVDMTDKSQADALESNITAIIDTAKPTKGPVTVTSGPILKK